MYSYKHFVKSNVVCDWLRMRQMSEIKFVCNAHVAVIRCKLQDGDFEETDGGEH